MPLLAPVTTAVRCMAAFCQSPAREFISGSPGWPACRLLPCGGVHFRFAGMARMSPTIGFVAELRGVIFDWGGVLTTPIIETVHAWLEADRIDRESYAAAMRPWISQAYGPDPAESPVHALERGELSDAEFEVILADLLTDVDGGPVAAPGLLKRMFAGSSPQFDMLDLVRELRDRGLRTG